MMEENKLLKEINYIYWAAYRAGHEDTVEGRYTDVIPSDRFTYHEEDVLEILQDGFLSGDIEILSYEMTYKPEKCKTMREEINAENKLRGIQRALFGQTNDCPGCEWVLEKIDEYFGENNRSFYND